jgi:hypothetical protein
LGLRDDRAVGRAQPVERRRACGDVGPAAGRPRREGETGARLRLGQRRRGCRRCWPRASPRPLTSA